ncbi:PAS/PAC sensor signal transduction histidine kinase [Terribacillus aidingensis]|uniref:histidine kinase n=1 Tax=Terribacillus aidingensis TaxID=586416 RepID=A0A285NS72_9BACI|nr:ATP-binding protein [Terribacillus aidingensis]SNZ11817.1 PAS/PAC sensor signal transduction histidine kinase [Terribacillus aidingensis]
MRRSSYGIVVYGSLILLIFAAIGFILMQITSEWFILWSVLLIGAALITSVLYRLQERYIKPVSMTAVVAEELVKGNYKARNYENFYGDAGRLIRSVNQIARNLHELELLEKMQEDQLETVIDNMESGLMLVDERGYVHLVNRKFLSVFGGKDKDYIGHVYHDTISQSHIHHVVSEAFLYEEKVRDAFILQREKEKRFFEIVAAPIFNDSYDLKGAVLVFYEITELKRVEEMRKDFVANVSHELKTPLTSIRGFSETLLEDGALEDRELTERFLTIINNESQRLQALVKDLLELSRLEKDELQIRMERLDFRKMVDTIMPIIEQHAESKQIQVQLELPDSVIMRGDEDRLKQLVINLMNNAVNYTSSNGSVRLKVTHSNDSVFAEISDTGLGIPEDSLDRIFERFYRVDKARSRNTGGTGLGLAIVKHVVEAHGGTISVSSEVNKGTTFSIRLPKALG